MLINGIHPIFIIPPILLILLALVSGIRRARRGDAKDSVSSVIRILVYGGLVLFLLFIGWVFLYYAGGGH